MSDHMTGDDVAFAFIRINDRTLWLDRHALDDDVVVGWNGDSEQCDDCGNDIAECGEVVRGRRIHTATTTYDRSTIRCRCGTEYEIQYKGGDK